jgi:hypothetical protein
MVNRQAGQQQLPGPVPGCYMLLKVSLRVSQRMLYTSYVLPVSLLAEKAELPNPCCHENLEYLFEIVQVKVPGSISYPPS